MAPDTRLGFMRSGQHLDWWELSWLARPCRSRSLEREFWEQVPLWESFELAAVAVGVSYRVGKRWVAESGGVKPKLI